LIKKVPAETGASAVDKFGKENIFSKATVLPEPPTKGMFENEEEDMESNESSSVATVPTDSVAAAAVVPGASETPFVEEKLKKRTERFGSITGSNLSTSASGKVTVSLFGCQVSISKPLTTEEEKKAKQREQFGLSLANSGTTGVAAYGSGDNLVVVQTGTDKEIAAAAPAANKELAVKQLNKTVSRQELKKFFLVKLGDYRKNNIYHRAEMTKKICCVQFSENSYCRQHLFSA